MARSIEIGKILDSDIEKDFEKKGLYDNNSSYDDWYGLANCEPIDENIKDTIDKLKNLESDCRFGTAVALLNLLQLLEESDKKLAEEIEKLQSKNKYYKDNYSKGIAFLIDCVRI